MGAILMAVLLFTLAGALAVFRRNWPDGRRALRAAVRRVPVDDFRRHARRPTDEFLLRERHHA